MTLDTLLASPARTQAERERYAQAREDAERAAWGPYGTQAVERLLALLDGAHKGGDALTAHAVLVAAHGHGHAVVLARGTPSCTPRRPRCCRRRLDLPSPRVRVAGVGPVAGGAPPS